MNINKNKEKIINSNVNEEIIKLKEIITEKDKLIQELKSELELSKQNKNLENSSNSNFEQQIINIENDINQLKQDKDELIKQNEQIRAQLGLKENYIASLNATITRLKI